MPDTVIKAIYERGVLRLLDPITLPEKTRVRVVIKPISEDEERQRTEQVLADTGLVTPPRPNVTIETVPEARLNDIAQRYAVGGPLVVADDRLLTAAQAEGPPVDNPNLHS